MADCKRKTANLFSSSFTDGYSLNANGLPQAFEGRIATLVPIAINAENCTLYYRTSKNTNFIFAVINNGTLVRRVAGKSNGDTIDTSGGDTLYICIYESLGQGIEASEVSEIMLNEGSTALPYEPYGWVHSLRKLTTATDTLTTLPADLYADGTNATVGLVGNMQQTGTPTPQNPIQPQETGDRTAQLFEDRISSCNIDANGNLTGNPSFDMLLAKVEQGVTYTASATITGVFFTTKPVIGSTSYDRQRMVFANATFTAPITGYLAFRVNAGNTAMLNTGSTALPYEPYGYKIPISSASTTTPVYLGEVESTRQIKKLVLTGEETWQNNFGTSLFGTTINNATVTGVTAISTNYKYNPIQSGLNNGLPNGEFALQTSSPPTALYIKDESYTTVETWRDYLAAQYANGTPVTVWYVLATPTTGIVNEPIRKIGDYADTVSGISIPTITGKDTVDVLTALKPSEVSLSYTGWHDASVKEKSENLFDKSLNEVYPNSTLGNVNEWSYGSGSTGTVIRMACKPNTTYTLSISNSVSTTVFRISITDSDEAPISGQLGSIQCTTLVNDGSLRQATITTTSGTKYILFQPQTAAAQDTVDSLMLNEGQTALPYEPYWQ